HPALRAPTRTPKSTLSLHDALPICRNAETDGRRGGLSSGRRDRRDRPGPSGRAQRQARLRATAAPRLKRLAGLDMTRLLFAVSALLALAYGAFGASFYEGDPPYVAGAVFKTSGVAMLGLIALLARSRLLAAALCFGALGDALLAWREETFLHGAFAFLIGHLFYIALFVRAGLGLGAFRRPPRSLAALALVVAAVVMTSMLTPRDNAMFVPLAVYTGVLTLMAALSFTLPAARWLAMLGAVLFFISD